MGDGTSKLEERARICSGDDEHQSLLRPTEGDIKEAPGIFPVWKGGGVTWHHQHVAAFEPFGFMDRADGGIGRFRPTIGAAVCYLGKACIKILEVAEPDRLPKLPAVIHLDVGEIRVALFQLG